jgi:hypothetical protein
MIARLAIIQRYNANYYYTIQTLTDVYSMNEPYTDFSASLFIVSFEFAGFSRHSLRLYQTKQTNCIIQSSRFGHPPIRLFQFLQRFQSYLFNFENKKAETSRDEAGRGETRRDETGRGEAGRDEARRDVAGRGGTWRLLRASDVSQSGLLIITVLFSLPVLDIRQSYLFLIWRARSQEMLYGMKSRVTHLQHLYRCGRGILPWCLASWMTIVSDARLGPLWSDFLCLRHLCSDRPFCSPFHGLILWADSFEYVLSFNFAVQPKKFVVKVSPYGMDNYVYCIKLAWLLWRFVDAVMA